MDVKPTFLVQTSLVEPIAASGLASSRLLMLYALKLFTTSNRSTSEVKAVVLLLDSELGVYGKMMASCVSD